MTNAASPILVTGTHRSGTTWAGRILATAPRTAYLHEPFNIDIPIGINSEPFRYWFQYIGEVNSGDYEALFANVLKYHYPLFRNIANIRSFRDAAKAIRDQCLFAWYKINGNRPIIKDPIAVFSAEWLHLKFNVQPLVMIRHPAAFCSSLKIKNYTFDFNHLLKQPHLMDKYLRPFETKFRKHAEQEMPLIDQAALLWNCIHHVIDIYQNKYKDWLYERHEDLSRNPVKRFEYLFDRLGLEFTSHTKRCIAKSSNSDNPTEQVPGNEFMRNSAENVYNWKRRLTDDEISQIKDETSDIAARFYSESDW